MNSLASESRHEFSQYISKNNKDLKAQAQQNLDGPCTEAWSERFSQLTVANDDAKDAIRLARTYPCT